jgi:hypothetical protein
MSLEELKNKPWRLKKQINLEKIKSTQQKAINWKEVSKVTRKLQEATKWVILSIPSHMEMS